MGRDGAISMFSVRACEIVGAYPPAVDSPSQSSVEDNTKDKGEA